MISEQKPERKSIFYFLNTAYYLFVLVFLSLFIVLALKININLLTSGLIIAIIFFSLIILVYLVTKMIIYNFKAGKKFQIGIFMFIFSFLLLVVSMLKHFFPTFFGTTNYAYWGLGGVAIGIFLELTNLDEFFVNLLKNSAIFIWEVTKAFYHLNVKLIKWLFTEGRNVLYEIIRLLISTAGVILALYISNKFDNPNYTATWLDWFLLLFGFAMFILGEFTRKTVVVEIWKLIKGIYEFFLNNWKIIVKELLRGIFAAGGILLIIYGKAFYLSHTYSLILSWFMMVSGIVIIPSAEIFSRARVYWFIIKYHIPLTRLSGLILIILSSVLLGKGYCNWFTITTITLGGIFMLFAKYIYRPQKLWADLKRFLRFFNFFVRHRTFTVSIIGLTLGIVFSVIVGKNGWTPLNGSLMIIGWIMFLFSYSITHPVKLWNFIKKLPHIVASVSKFIWKITKYITRYLFNHILQLLLLLVTIFTFVYGFLVLINEDFLHLFSSIAASARISIGIGFLIMSVASFYLLRNELKKLIVRKTGQTFDTFSNRRNN